MWVIIRCVIINLVVTKLSNPVDINSNSITGEIPFIPVQHNLIFGLYNPIHSESDNTNKDSNNIHAGDYDNDYISTFEYLPSDSWGFQKNNRGRTHHLNYAWGWNPIPECHGWADAYHNNHGWLTKKEKKKHKKYLKKQQKKCKRALKRKEKKRKKQWKKIEKLGPRQPCGEGGCRYTMKDDGWNGWKWWRPTTKVCNLLYGWGCGTRKGWGWDGDDWK